MKPYFSPGDIVVVTPEPTRDVRVGQVISYHIPVGDHHVQSHRVIEVVRGGDTRWCGRRATRTRPRIRGRPA